MSVWMSEKEFRQSDPGSIGVTINVAFLKEIKEDCGFREVLNSVYQQLNFEISLHPRKAAELLAGLRDELETYFALEEFFGYFEHSAVANPSVSQASTTLRNEHEKLYLQFNELVEMSEQIVYRECSPEITVKDLASRLDKFCVTMAEHEQAEMDLMMRLVNEEIGVGD